MAIKAPSEVIDLSGFSSTSDKSLNPRPVVNREENNPGIGSPKGTYVTDKW